LWITKNIQYSIFQSGRKDKMEILSRKVVAARKEFITKASLCEFNHLWSCRHPHNGGIRCTEICKYYLIQKDETED